MYTPEKSRKSLPLLLEGNLPYRRTRRQSAPAKDIQAALHPSVSLKVSSESELCQADSTNTLTSSVIQGDNTEAGLGLDPSQEEQEEEEEEEEELAPLSPPPTLSITEEILEFINQSRVREGLASINTGMEQTSDQPKQNQPPESPSPSNPTNFTCPLPPVACPPSPEQGPAVQLEQDRAKMEEEGREEEEGTEMEESLNTVQETLDETSQAEDIEESDGETRGGETDSTEKKEEERREEGEGESTVTTPTPLSSPLLPSDPHPSILAEKESEEVVGSDQPGEQPDPLRLPIQSPPPPKRGFHLTRSDKKIIEKIRSYYEAAAGAVEEEEEEEGDEEEVGPPRRRNSFSQIPSGLVRESVSRFGVRGQQGEPVGRPDECGTVKTPERERDGVTDKDVERSAPSPPASLPVSLAGQKDGEVDRPITSMDGHSDGQASPAQSTTNLQLNSITSDREESESSEQIGEVCTEEMKERETSAVTEAEEEHSLLHTRQEEGKPTTKEDKHGDETKTSIQPEPVLNRNGTSPVELAALNGSHKEPTEVLPSVNQPKKTETRAQPGWTRTQTRDRDLTNPSGSLEGLPSQIKVGRWSRHSRIVSANRALFEGSGSDIAGIGFRFEAGPVVDPAVMENSERILSKVQTLARMYSAKASTMKVPLHQKRACVSQSTTWASARPGGVTQNQNQRQTQLQYHTQTQTQTKHWHRSQSQNQCQNKLEANRQTQAKTVTETKSHQTQTQTETKYQPNSKYDTQPRTETKYHSQTATHTRYQTQTRVYNQYQTQTDPVPQNQHRDERMMKEEERKEERLIKRAESLTNDYQEPVIAACEPLLFGHMFVREQLPAAHHQTNGYTLSRPRDFISALSQEQCSNLGYHSSDTSNTSGTPRDNLQSTTPGHEVSNLPQDKSYNPGCSSTERPLTSSPLRDHLTSLPEERSSSLGCASSEGALTSTMALDLGSALAREDRSASPTDRASSLVYSPTNSPLSSWIPGQPHTALHRPEERAGKEEEGNKEVVIHNREVYSDPEATEKRERSELNDGHHLDSIREDSTSITPVSHPTHSGPNLSAHDGTQWTSTGDTANRDEQDQHVKDIQFIQDIQDIQGPTYKLSTGAQQNVDTSTKDGQDSQCIQSIKAGPEYMMCAGSRDEEAKPGETVVMVVSTQTQAPTEYRSSAVLDPGLARDEAHGEAPYHGEGGYTALGLSGGPKKDKSPKEDMMQNETEDDSSLQTKTYLCDSATAKYEPTQAPGLPQPHSDPSHVTFDLAAACQTVAEAPEGSDAERGGMESSPFPSAGGQDPNPTPPPSRPLSVQSVDCLPTFTSQRPADLPATMGKRALSTANTTPPALSSRESEHQGPGSLPALPRSGLSSGRHLSSSASLETPSLVERLNLAVPSPGQAADLPKPSSAFRPNLRHRSPSPIRGFPTSPSSPSPSSSVRAPPCSSPFRAIPASSPTPGSAGSFTSPSPASRAPPCFSPSPSSSSGRSSTMRATPPFSPVPSSSSSSSFSGRSSSMRAGHPPSSSPTPSPSLRAPPSSSPTPSSSAFTRSLAASCISQSISQSMAKKNNARQQTTPPTTGTQGPASLSSSHLRLRSPSPKLTPGLQGSCMPAHAQPGGTKDMYQHSRCTPASPVQSPPPYRSQSSPSPSVSLSHHQPSPNSSSPSPSLLRSKSAGISDSPRYLNNNNNNNNNSVNGSLAASTNNLMNISHNDNRGINGNLGNGSWSVSQRDVLLANGSTNATTAHQSHDPLWSGSHNRIARPFSASEPSSRVQSPSALPSPCPSPSPSPASLKRLCSPPPQHNFSSPMANKPPHPRSARTGSAGPHNPLGLTLELPRSSSTSSATGPSSSYPSPRILSPPPIGVSVNVWTNNVAAPQPRNPRVTSSSPSACLYSLASPTSENPFSPFPTSSSTVSLRGSRASSPSPSSSTSQTTSQNLCRSRGSSLADRAPSPARRNPSGLRRSWAESSRRSIGFSGSHGGSFDQQESGLTSPRSGWSSYGGSPSCLSPRAELQSPLSPSRLTLGKGTLGGQHFTSVPWPDVRELLTKYDGADSPDRSATATPSSPVTLSSSHTLLSSTSPLSSPPSPQTEWGDPELEEGNCRSQLICAYMARPSSAQNAASSQASSSSGMTSPPPPHSQHQNYRPQVKSPALSPLPSTHSIPAKPGSQKTSYATTVNLQIAGSGRITSFSTAQVSLTQTLQAGAGAAGPGQGQGTRRVSINGLSHLPPPSLLP
ncbi:uncharacterized protein ACJ7VT_002650 [Polymixia lowei]